MDFKRISRNCGLSIIMVYLGTIKVVQWSSGYDFCLTSGISHRRSPVRSWIEPLFFVCVNL
jgi:hypothetical protein